MTGELTDPVDCGTAQFSDLENPGADPELPVVQSAHFGKLWAPRTLAEFAALVQSSSLAKHGPISGWRGQSDVRCPMHSGAVRRLQAQPRGWLIDTAAVTERVVRE